MSDATLSCVTALPLTCVELRYCQITDKGLDRLCGMRGLERLVLTGNPITDSSVGNLSKLHTLRELLLRWTQVSDEGSMIIKSAARRLRRCPLSA